ncbi:WD40 repeat-like protein [Gonapodya prolifera JEL478]|uniref:WD40 repeat-like protein n=1 Tax=Gonapodya prolifera (strain JEL478) TaxID=1344416 RepID=A0A139AN24_GONPJ|nr:WD40 repeat-like protein [Gonapodya prolifera JEL478]|eukprot:KXS18004.1 WD40 repeat-like protein [Gonapodya prolifera JEL478]
MSSIPSAELKTLNGHTGGPVHVCRFNNDGNYVLTGGHDKTVKLWNPNSGLCIKTYTGHGWEVLGLAVAHDNARFCSGGTDKSVILWDIGTGRIIRRFNGHFRKVNTVEFNADATVIASGSYDATVRLWDARAQSKIPIQIVEGPYGPKDDVTSLKIMGSEMLVGSVDGYIRNYDIRAGRIYADNIGSPVTSVQFSHDTNCILASSLDGVIRLFDKSNGELLADFKGHKNTSYRVPSCLTPTDAHVVSGSEDGRVVFWDLVDGKLVRELQQSQEGRTVTALDVQPVKDAAVPLVVSGSADGTVKVWGR